MDRLPGEMNVNADRTTQDLNTTAIGEAANRQATSEELTLLAALRRKDEGAFTDLVNRYNGSLLRLARFYVQSQAVAEEVVQETWLGVLQGLDRFEGRSSVRTWLFRILMNRARTRAVRESRMIPFSAMWDAAEDAGAPAVEASRFRAAGDPYPGHWTESPQPFPMDPEQATLSGELRYYLQQAIAALPPNQREVIVLRDIEQWTSEEVCNVLGLSETNQRVLLHRARSKVRRALEGYFGQGNRGTRPAVGSGVQGARGTHNQLSGGSAPRPRTRAF